MGECMRADGGVIPGTNLDKDIIGIKHSELTRSDSETAYKSNCPACDDGILLVARDQETLVLEEYDRCVLCGQAFRYLDIEEMRRKEK